MTYLIPKNNIIKITEELAKLNRKAKKLDLTPVEFEITGETEDSFIIEVNNTEPVQIKGWDLVAVIENTSNGENLVKAVPGAGEIPDKYRNADSSECDHCHTKRKRSKLFLLRNGEEFKQVGSSCLQDFFAADPSVMLEAASLYVKFHEVLTDREPYTGGQKHSISYSTKEVVTLACAIIRKHGYTSKKTAEAYDKESTASTVAWAISHHSYSSEAQMAADFIKNLNITEADRERADKIIDWAKSLPKTGVSDYVYNLGVAFRNMYTTPSSFGFVVSGAEAYRKEFEKTVERSAKKPSQWIGEVGDKITTKAKVTFVLHSESQWGDTTMIILEEEGTDNVLVWWASGYKNPVMEQIFSITGTVKKHENRKDVNQTVITRVKGIEWN